MRQKNITSAVLDRRETCRVPYSDQKLISQRITWVKLAEKIKCSYINLPITFVV